MTECHPRNFQKAVACGRVKKITGENGEELWCRARVATGVRRGHLEKTSTEEVKKLTGEQARAIGAAMKKLKFDFTLTAQERKTEQLENVFAEKTKAKMGVALEAMNKSCKSAETVLPLVDRVGSTAAEDAATKLREKLKELYSHVQSINSTNLGLDKPNFKGSDRVRDDLQLAAKCILEVQDRVDVAKSLCKK